MARPRRMSLDYDVLDVFFLQDNKIRMLQARYQNDGVIVYLELRAMILRGEYGYYMHYDEDTEYVLSDTVKIDVNKVKQVLSFLLKRSMLDSKLFSSDKVLTSAGIQRQWQLAKKEAGKKKPFEVGRYWLLSKEETEPFIKCSLFEINHGEIDNYSGRNDDYSRNETTKESKVNNIHTTAFPPELESAFQVYLLVRSNNYGEIIPEQIQALRDDLMSLSSDIKEQIAIVRKATASGYKSFFSVDGKKRKEAKQTKKKNDFNNFQGRDYSEEQMKSLIQM